jgi:hypothetical protein
MQINRATESARCALARRGVLQRLTAATSLALNHSTQLLRAPEG